MFTTSIARRVAGAAVAACVAGLGVLALAAPASAAPALSATIGPGVCNLNEGNPIAIEVPGVFVTVSNAGTDPGDYRILVNGSAYIGGATAPAGSQGGQQGIVLGDQYSLVEVLSGTASQPGDDTLIATRVVAINGCEDGVVDAPVGTIDAVVSDAVCNVNAGTPAIITAGAFVNVTNNTDQPAVERILKNGEQYIGPGVLLPGESDGGGAVVLGFQDSATIAVEINGEIVASKEVTTNCTPDGQPIVVTTPPATTPPVTTPPATTAPATTAPTTPTTPATTAPRTSAPSLANTGADRIGLSVSLAAVLVALGLGMLAVGRGRVQRKH